MLIDSELMVTYRVIWWSFGTERVLALASSMVFGTEDDTFLFSLVAARARHKVFIMSS